MVSAASLPFNVEMPAAGSDACCPAVEEVWRTSTAILCYVFTNLPKVQGFRPS